MISHSMNLQSINQKKIIEKADIERYKAKEEFISKLEY